MRGGIFLAAVLLTPALSATQSPAPSASPTAEAAQASPDPRLIRLDGVLRRTQNGRSSGRLSEDRYREFAAKFRSELDALMPQVEPSPENAALHARLLARLGDAKSAQESVSAALKRDPASAELHVAAAALRYDAQDYPGALAEAEAALKIDPRDKEALALKHFSAGRGTGSESVTPSASANAPSASVLGGSAGVVRAQRRDEAIRLSVEAMGRLKIGDTREALRLLSLAEARDSTLGDVPMQQGLAYMQLKRPRDAVPRFARAEELWSAAGENEKAATAKDLRTRTVAALSAPLSADAARSPTRSNRGLIGLFGGGAAGLLLAGLGALKSRGDDEGRRPARIVALAGVGLLGGGLLGYTGAMILATGAGGGAFVLAGAGGETLATAGATEAAATAGGIAGAVAGGAAGARVGANAGNETGKDAKRESDSSDTLPKPSPATGSLPAPEDLRLRSAQYDKAKNHCDSPPPAGENECSTLSRQIDHAKICIELYQAWDDRWLPGRHHQKISSWNLRLQKLKDEHKKKCANMP